MRRGRAIALLVGSFGAACLGRDGPPPVRDFFERPVPAVGGLTVVGLAGEPFGRKVLAASLQGIVNGREVRLYLVDGRPGQNRYWETTGEESSQRFWLEHYRARYGVPVVSEVLLDEALVRFAREAAGYVLASEDEPWTLGAATTIAGLRGALVATPLDAAHLEALGLPRLEDLRGRWLSNEACIRDTLASLYPRASPLALGILSPKEYRLRDFLIQNRLFTLYSRPGDSGWDALLEVLARTPPNQPIFGYLSETGVEEFFAVRALSYAGKFLVPSDTTANLSVHSAIRAAVPAPRPVAPAPCARGTLRVVVAISDGDNLAIPLNRYIAERYWLAPDRGDVPVGWSLAPGLVLLAPAIAAFYAGGRAEAEELVGMLGIGYAHPTALPDPSYFLERSFDALARFGMTALWQLDAVLDVDRDAPIWESLSQAFAERRVRGVLLGYIGAGTPAPFWTRTGMPVLPASNRYEDTPAEIEERIRGALAAWRAGGPDVLFLSAAVWNNDFTGLAGVIRRMRAESELTFLTPSRALECLANQCAGR
jgi:hypothetical protein